MSYRPMTRQRVQRLTFYGLRSRMRRMSADEWVLAIVVPIGLMSLWFA